MQFTSKLLICFLLIFVSFISVADLLYRPGHPITFDGHIHMTTMNQFAQSLYDGEFPVTWANNFANYGHPLPIIAHQIPAYLGALLILLGFSTELAYISLISITIIILGFLFYTFFRKFADQTLALTATIFSIFFPYRMLNLYTRGGLPELMATCFLPVLLFAVYNLKQKNYFKSILLFYFGIVGTALTHPMMLLIFSVPVIAYFFFAFDKKTWKKDLSLTAITTGLAGLTSGYYLLPLLIEMRYFYQSRVEKAVGSDTFLTLKQLHDPTWFYTLTHPGPRGNYIKLGTIEFILLVLAILLLIKVSILAKNKFIKQHVVLTEIKNLRFWTFLTAGLILLMLPISKFLYSLPLIYQIQYPWRFLTALQITIPLVFIFFIKSIKKANSPYILIVFIGLVLWFRIPEFYGKNYIVQPESDYYFNQANLHSTNFNTVWSSNTEDYPRKTVQAEIIEGEGELNSIEEKNASRIYSTKSDTELRLIDYTFYFPGWTAYVDGKPVTIEFQDPNYRGLITYTVPAGEHQIKVKYQYSNVRLLGLFATLVGSAGFILFLYTLRSKYLKSH